MKATSPILIVSFAAAGFLPGATFMNSGLVPNAAALDASDAFGAPAGTFFRSGQFAALDVPAPDGWEYSNLGEVTHGNVGGGQFFMAGNYPVDPSVPSQLSQTFLTETPGTYRLEFLWFQNAPDQIGQSQVLSNGFSVSVGGQFLENFVVAGIEGNGIAEGIAGIEFESDGGEETVVFEWAANPSLADGDFARPGLFAPTLTLVPESSSALLGCGSALLLLRRKRKG